MADIAQIGFAVDTTDLARANVELDRLAQKERPVRQSAQGIVRSVDGLNSGFNRALRSIVSLNSALAAFGAGFALQRVVRSFADFEQQLIAVGKTTDLQGRQLERLGERIQQVGRRVPVSTQRLLELATAAGQLGVKGVDDITRFAETLGQLEVATDVAGEQGARSLARLLNVTGQAISDIDRLGSSITALGNNFATTEQEIVQTSTFLAASTQQFDLNAQAVVGLSAALRSLGQRAETSGSSVGAALTEINTAIATGGENLQTLVDLTGQTQQQLQRTFGENATRVLLDFADALGDLPAAEQTRILDDFNLAGRETRRVIGALIADTEMVRDALRTANTEWSRNQALNLEAARAAESFASQMRFLGNALNEAAVDIGRELAPVVLRIAENFRDLVQNAADTGQLENFFEGAATAAQRFLDKLEDIARIILALAGGIKGATLGASVGGGPGAAAGGIAGALAGFFSIDALGALARSLGEETRALEVAQNRVEALVKRQAELRRLLRVDEEGNIPQAIRESQEALAARSDEPTGLEEFERLPEQIEKARFQLAQIREEMSPTTQAANAMAQALLDAGDAANEAANGANNAGDAAQGLTAFEQRLADRVMATSDTIAEQRQELQNLTQGVQDLREQAFPAVAELNRLGQAAATLGEAVQRGVIEAAEAERILSALEDQMPRTSRETEEAGRTVRELGGLYKSNAEIMLESTREFVRGSQGELADFFDDFFRGQINSIGDLWDGMLDVMRRSLSEFIAAVATQRIILPIGLAAIGGGGILAGTGGGGGIGGASNALSAGGQLASLGGFDLGASLNSIGFSSGIFGAGSSGAAGALNVGSSVGVNGFNIAGASSAAPPSATGIFGTSATLSGTLGAAGLGALGGGLLTNLAGLNQTGGSIGGGLGAGVGFVAGGPIGAGIGGLLGAVGGGFIGDLFGDRDFPFARADVGTRGGRLAIRNTVALDDGPLNEIQQATQRVVDRINAFAEQIGADAIRLNQGFVRFGTGSGNLVRSGFFTGNTTTGSGRQPEFQGLSAEEAATRFQRLLLDQATFTGLADDIEEAIRKGLRRGRSLEQITQDVARIRQEEQISLRAQLGVRQNVLGAASSIQGFLDQQRLSQQSSLSPTERLQEAQAQFQERLQAVRGGEIGATQGLLRSAETLIGFGRDQFASTVSFANLEQSVRSQLAQVGQRLTSESFIGDQVTTAIQQQTTAQLDSDQATRDTINDLKREIRLLNQKLDDVAAQAA